MVSSMHFHVGNAAPLAPALKHVMLEIIKLPCNLLETTKDSDVIDDQVKVCIGKDQSSCYKGVMPTVRALRQYVKQSSTDAVQETINFLGDESSVAFINGWIEVALLLMADAAEMKLNNSTSYKSLAPSIFAQIELTLTANHTTHKFLTHSRKATIADLLLYYAIHSHPLHHTIPHHVLEWSVFVEEDGAIAPLAFKHVKELAKTLATTHGHKKATKVDGAEHQPNSNNTIVTHTKPSEEEILRRRREKEIAKAQKEAAKAASAAAAATSSASGSSSSAITANADHGTQLSTSKSSEHAKAGVNIADLDVRVGRFISVRVHTETDKLFVEEMDLGNGQVRTIVSGLVGHYTPEELTNTLCLVVCNMRPMPFKGVRSQGMILCAEKNHSYGVLRPPAGAQPGDRIIFSQANDLDFTDKPMPTSPLGSNRMTELIAQLHTNDKGQLCWKDVIAKHANGTICLE